MQLLDKLPHYFRPRDGDEVPQQLIGARILRFGTVETEKRGLEGGGLVIEYTPKNSRRRRRILFEFTEEGMWTGFDVDVTSTEDNWRKSLAERLS